MNWAMAKATTAERRGQLVKIEDDDVEDAATSTIAFSLVEFERDCKFKRVNRKIKTQSDT